jgi:hypothetical protein
MLIEEGRVRNFIDLTGLILVPKQPNELSLSNGKKGIEIPRVRGGLPVGFFDKANNVMHGLSAESFEIYSSRLYGTGNLAKRLLIDQGFGWEVMNKPQIDRILDQQIQPIEAIGMSIADHLRSAIRRWVHTSGTIIDLDDFAVDYERWRVVTTPREGEILDNTIVSGNSYRDRVLLVSKLGERLVDDLDPNFGIVLPPHCGVGAIETKPGTGFWWTEKKKKKARFHEDDLAMAYILSILGEVIMPMSRAEAYRQTHLEEVLRASEIKEWNESNIKFAA